MPARRMCFAFALAQSQMRAVSPPALLKTKDSSAQPAPPCLVVRAAQALTAYTRQLFEIPISELMNQDFTAPIAARPICERLSSNFKNPCHFEHREYPRLGTPVRSCQYIWRPSLPTSV